MKPKQILQSVEAVLIGDCEMHGWEEGLKRNSGWPRRATEFIYVGFIRFWEFYEYLLKIITGFLYPKIDVTKRRRQSHAERRLKKSGFCGIASGLSVRR